MYYYTKESIPFCILFFLLAFFLCEIQTTILLGMMQSVEVIKYTDEEYEKHLKDPVGIKSCLHVYVFAAAKLLGLSALEMY